MRGDSTASGVRTIYDHVDATSGAATRCAHGTHMRHTCDVRKRYPSTAGIRPLGVLDPLALDHLRARAAEVRYATRVGLSCDVRGFGYERDHAL